MNIPRAAGCVCQPATGAHAADQLRADTPAVRSNGQVCDRLAFSGFIANLQITISTGSFDLTSAFALGAGSNDINPLTEAVTLQIGAYSVTIPPGSFTKNSKGAYVFQGTINGVPLQVRINPTGNNSYTFQAEGTGANHNSTTNPVTVTLTIGDDTRTTQSRGANKLTDQSVLNEPLTKRQVIQVEGRMRYGRIPAPITLETAYSLAQFLTASTASEAALTRKFTKAGGFSVPKRICKLRGPREPPAAG